MRPLTPAEKLAGICEVCRNQPCTCALTKDPFWVDRLEIEVDLQAIEDCCDSFLTKYATRHMGNTVATAAFKMISECAETAALARSILRGDSDPDLFGDAEGGNGKTEH